MSELPETTLSAYLDGELSAADAAAVARHLADCPDCRRRLAALRAAVALVRAAAPAPETVDLTAGIQAAAARIDVRREQARVRVRHALGAVLLAFAAAAAALAVWQSTPVLLGVGILRLAGAVIATLVQMSPLPSGWRLLLLVALLAGAWPATWRLRRALRQAELRS